MTRQFHRPARLAPAVAAAIAGGEDPAVASELAHRAAQALIGGFPGTETDDDPITRSGVVTAFATNGIDDIAELWADSPATTLPGTLWRLFLVREWIRRDPGLVARRYATVVEAAGKDPSERARALADALTLDGYAASVRDVGDGSFAVQLCQGNCPVRDVAGEFHELCDAETQAISRLVGVPVQRLATLAGGEHVCTTHIPIAMPALRKRAVRAAAKTRGLETKRMEGTR